MLSKVFAVEIRSDFLLVKVVVVCGEERKHMSDVPDYHGLSRIIMDCPGISWTRSTYMVMTTSTLSPRLDVHVDGHREGHPKTAWRFVWEAGREEV